MVYFSGFTNIDGLSNSYTDNLYGYAPSPKCNSSNPNGCNSTCPLSEIGGAPPPPLQLASVQSADVTEDETCVNLNQCCGPWSSRGECESNTAVLRVVCPASCGRCTPKRSLADACANRVTLCPLYVMQGKCKSNRDWMAENCRMACNLCKKTRAKSCPASTKRPKVVGSQAGGSQGGGLGAGAPNIASVSSAPNVGEYDGTGDDAKTYEDSGYQANDSQAATSDGSRYDAAGDDAKNYENIGSQTISSTTDAYSSKTIATTTEYLPNNLTSSSPLPKCQVSNPMKPKPGNNTNNLLNGPVRNHSVCLNSHFCCQKWSSSGKCNSDKDIMSHICRASCVCKIGNDPNRCADFIKNCLSYKKQGLCGVDYMKENCRLTCRSCFSLSQQEHMCATPVRNITQPVETGISY
uniref:ShTK domain protein n=1 Tax=Heterorhabditis bacteriophora TaxID=37862 RepID=A0A1I7XH76_HETBA